MAIEPLRGVKRLGLGYGYSCAILTDGSLVCWGRNDLGQSRATCAGKPTRVAGWTNLTDVSAGYFNTCVLTRTGTMACFGQPYATEPGPPMFAPQLDHIAQIVVSHYHSFARKDDGTLWCWNAGGCDPDHRAPGNAPVVQQRPAVAGAVEVAEHWDKACVRMRDGSVACWGAVRYEGSFGGQASVHTSNEPQVVAGLTGATAISVGNGTACALVAGGEARCWGLGWHGGLGDGTLGITNTPVPVKGLRGAVAIASGGIHSCALLADGTVRCWGGNDHGELGDGTTEKRTEPVAVKGLSGRARSIAAGGDHTCAVLEDGTAQCWGSNAYGELGNKSSGAPVGIPVTVEAPE